MMNCEKCSRIGLWAKIDGGSFEIDLFAGEWDGEIYTAD